MPLIKKCYFGGCNHNAKDNKQLAFFHFPPKRCEEWRVACKNGLLNQVPKQSLIKNYFVCENHFSLDQFLYVTGPFNKKLKPGAVPAMFGQFQGKNNSFILLMKCCISCLLKTTCFKDVFFFQFIISFKNSLF